MKDYELIRQLNEMVSTGVLRKKDPMRDGYDIPMPRPVRIEPGIAMRIKTDVKFPAGLPETVTGLITMRSSYQTSDLILPSVGLYDGNYTGYLYLVLRNVGEDPVDIEEGECVTQIFFTKVLK